MDTSEPRVAKRVAFEARDDGLYQSLGSSAWHRVARRSEKLVLRYGHGRLRVGRPCSADENLADDDPFETRGEPSHTYVPSSSRHSTGETIVLALRQLREHLSDLDGIFDLSRGQCFSSTDHTGHGVNGFIVKVPGAGRMFAIRPEALRNWVTGSAPFRPLMAALEAHGWLIRGADGKTTRQIVIRGLGRQRYYCLKLQAAAPARPTTDDDWGLRNIAQHRKPMRTNWE